MADDRSGGGDALCFTAGYKGSAFGAGVIHAYLASDRKPPLVAAGISTGALSAAAMQRVYQELEKAKDSDGPRLEACRWRWFQRYLTHLTHSPFSFLWRALPNPVDFFSDRPPVKDSSPPEGLRKKEAKARHAYFLLVLFGRWLARLPITVRDVTRLAVAHVRHKEGYSGNRISRWLGFRGLELYLAFLLLTHLALTPMWVAEKEFRRDRAALKISWLGSFIRPLFGVWWLVGLVLWLLLVAVLVAILGSAIFLIVVWAVESWWPTLGDLTPFVSWARWSLVGGLAFLAGSMLIWVFVSKFWRLSGKLIEWLTQRLMKELDLSRGLLNDYHLHRRLLEVFRESDGSEPKIVSEPTRLVVVTTPLNLSLTRERNGSEGKHKKPLSGQQLWAKSDSSLITALRAALTIPPLFPPVRLTETDEEIRRWWTSQDKDPPKRLDLVDGSVVRKNPLPAFFAYLRESDQEDIAQELCAASDGSGPPDARVHVVYNVPIEPKESPREQESLDIVESTFLSLTLASRRDTRMEVRQTNSFSKIQLEIEHARKQTGTKAKEGAGVLAIFADEIAPEKEIRFDNAFDPTREELLKVAAAGCRRTLERLYRDDLRAMGPGTVSCRWLLERVAARRRKHLTDETPGLPEVCRACTRALSTRDPRSQVPELQDSFGDSDYDGSDGSADPEREKRLVRHFPHLTGEHPRIVFLASGGVFRGATHIGVVGALRAMETKPDLVVGASVGTLMGSALAAISRLGEEETKEESYRLLARLTDTFLRVDQTVALTRTLKNAAKQLGVRGRSVELSPRQLRRHILRGSGADPGFATVGAPSVLTDALSRLFLMPHTCTTEIAAQFVAGHFPKATAQFLEQVQKDTLRRLEIRYALMGTELLEPKARELLGASLKCGDHRVFRMDCCQPYHRLRDDMEPSGEHRWVSVFSTTTLLNHQTGFLLGRDFLRPAPIYDFVQAGLCSSAFPAFFSPRREAEVFSGAGRPDVLFADGGMFDNLPFFPALKVLGRIQQAHRESLCPVKDKDKEEAKKKTKKEANRKTRELLAERFARPDLFLTAALEAPPEHLETGRTSDLDTLRSIYRQTKSLRNNLKIASFEKACRTVDRQLKELLRLWKKKTPPLCRELEFVDGLVSAAVLPVIPKDKEHINPTFACCRSLGMDPERVSRAIAHGCFQTFATLARKQPTDKELRNKKPLEDVLKRSLKSLQTEAPPGYSKPRLPRVTPRDKKLAKPKKGTCPFFLLAWKAGDEGTGFTCPFVRAAEPSGDGASGTAAGDSAGLTADQLEGVRGIYQTCCKDPLHERHLDTARRRSDPVADPAHSPAL